MKILSPPRSNESTTATSTCELSLCKGREAAVYCASDLASLCWSCDAEVHDANFLVARHVRCAICSKCKAFTGIHLSGACLTPSSPLPVCPSCCSPSIDSSSSSSSSSATLSSATSTTTNTISTTAGNKMHHHLADSGRTIANSRSHADTMKAGAAVLVKWCRILGLPQDHQVVKAALKALRRSIICWDMMRQPFRVCLAAALWFGFTFLRERRRSLSTWYVRVLRRLQETSGVPARLISAAESKLDSVFKLPTRKQRPHRLQEDWAETECSA